LIAFNHIIDLLSRREIIVTNLGHMLLLDILHVVASTRHVPHVTYTSHVNITLTTCVFPLTHFSHVNITRIIPLTDFSHIISIV
jgi:hypothetical protein